MDAPPWGDTGGHTGTAPTHLHHIFPRIPHKQNNHLHTIHPNDINRFMRNLPKQNRRGGAYVPARTSAQRRFHTQMDECNYTHIGGGNASRTPAPIL